MVRRNNSQRPGHAGGSMPAMGKAFQPRTQLQHPPSPVANRLCAGPRRRGAAGIGQSDKMVSRRRGRERPAIHQLDSSRGPDPDVHAKRWNVKISGGTYNAVAPNPATNAEFMRELRRALHRPWSPPVAGLGGEARRAADAANRRWRSTAAAARRNDFWSPAFNINSRNCAAALKNISVRADG